MESSARPLPEEEVLAAYERAERIYGWFDLAPLPSSGQPSSVNGRTYYPVDMEGIVELEDLRTYLRGVFSQELTDRLLSGEAARISYQDVNAFSASAARAGSTTPERAGFAWRRNSWRKRSIPLT